jgi:hypothetical protein
MPALDLIKRNTSVTHTATNVADAVTGNGSVAGHVWSIEELVRLLDA